MRSSKFLFLIGSLMSVFLLISCGVAEDTVTRDYEESFFGISEIELDGRFLEVSYEGKENEDEVFLNAYMEVPESSGMEIKYRKSGSKLKIEVTGESMNGWNFGNRFNGYISLTGPENIKLKFTNSSGAMEVMHVDHKEIDLKVNSGSIKTNELNVENMRLAASSGRITGDGLYGNVQVNVNSGAINLSNVEGDVDAKGSSGSLKFENVEGVVNAKVNSGTLRFNNVKSLGNLEVSSGSVKAENSGLSKHTSLRANSGSINIQTGSDLQAYNFDLNANSGSVKVGDKRSGKNLRIDNGADVTIVGKVSSGSIKIEI